MAILQNLSSQRCIMLRPLHAFGRYASACQTVLRAADVSQIHARIRWNDGQWEIVDQSRNGTSMNGRRLVNGVWTKLVLNAKIRMGEDDETVWTVHSLEPPLTSLFSLDSTLSSIALSPKGNLLPDVGQPVADIHCRDGNWLVEYPEGTDHLVDGATIRIQDLIWEFVLCPSLQETKENCRLAPPPRVHDMALQFNVSQDEEHTELAIDIDGHTFDLGERIHHYALLTLARQRMQDSERGLDALAQGWISAERLSRMLGVETSHINIQLFRVKHQIAGALPEGLCFAPIFERRRGELRFGEHAFTIKKGMAIEGRIDQT